MSTVEPHGDEIARRLERARILVVDDLPANLDLLLDTLESAGYTVLAARNGEAGLTLARQELPDLVLMDVEMPGIDGFEAATQLQRDSTTAHIPVIFLTVRDDQSSIVRGFSVGAADYIIKPFQAEEVLARVRTHLERSLLAALLRDKNHELETRTDELTRALSDLQQETSRRERLDGRLSAIARREQVQWGIDGFVGQSTTLQQVLGEVSLLSNADAVSVMITGESGTGKELVARAIHHGSGRADGAFVPVNCAAIPGELAESLFFGHRRGAFTGASEDQPGYFELADSGTLFLDEVGAMPRAIQPKLLRVLEDGVIRPLGAAHDIQVDVRVVSATNEPLTGVRDDLYYRLARFEVEIPALRDRAEDIELLASHFLGRLSAEMNRPAPGLTAGALAALRNYPFPGNVRELRNIAERALIRSGGAAMLGVEHLQLERVSTMPGPDAVAEPATPRTLEEIELDAMQQALDSAGGNVARAARMLGIDRNKIYRRLGRTRRDT